MRLFSVALLLGSFLVLGCGDFAPHEERPKADPPKVAAVADPKAKEPVAAKDRKRPVPKAKEPVVLAPDTVRVGHITVTAIEQHADWFIFVLSTKDETKNTQFTAWSDSIFKVPDATDEFDNKYAALAPYIPGTHFKTYPSLMFVQNANFAMTEIRKTLPGDWGLNPADRGDGSGPLNARMPRADLIVYEPLAPGAKRRIIELPAKNLGGEGALRFTFQK